jgi:hypothetical protein
VRIALLQAATILQTPDPLSQQTCRRLLVSLALLIFWAMVLSPQGFWVGVAVMSGVSASIAAIFALLRRERLLAPSLNYWDEAMAFVGVHCLTGLLI